MDSQSIANRVKSCRASRMAHAGETPMAAPQLPSTPTPSGQALPIFKNPRTGLPLVPRPPGSPGSPPSSGRKRNSAELEEDDPEHAAALAEARRGKRVCRDDQADPVPAGRMASPPQGPVTSGTTVRLASLPPGPMTSDTTARLASPPQGPVTSDTTAAAVETGRETRKYGGVSKRARILKLQDPVFPSLKRPLPKSTLLYHHFVCRRGGPDARGIDHLHPEDGAAIRGAEALFDFRVSRPEAVMPTPAEIRAWLVANQDAFRANRAAAAGGSSPRRRPQQQQQKQQHQHQHQQRRSAAPWASQGRRNNQVARPAATAAAPEELGFLRRAVRTGRRALGRVRAQAGAYLRRIAPPAPNHAPHQKPDTDAVVPATEQARLRQSAEAPGVAWPLVTGQVAARDRPLLPQDTQPPRAPGPARRRRRAADPGAAGVPDTGAGADGHARRVTRDTAATRDQNTAREQVATRPPQVLAMDKAQAAAAATKPAPAVGAAPRRLRPRHLPSGGSPMPGHWLSSPATPAVPAVPRRRPGGTPRQGEGGRFYVPEFSDSSPRQGEGGRFYLPEFSDSESDS